jgi:hypothetical protein
MVCARKVSVLKSAQIMTNSSEEILLIGQRIEEARAYLAGREMSRIIVRMQVPLDRGASIVMTPSVDCQGM